jgi:hypothetical protein
VNNFAHSTSIFETPEPLQKQPLAKMLALFSGTPAEVKGGKSSGKTTNDIFETF